MHICDVILKVIAKVSLKPKTELSSVKLRIIPEFKKKKKKKLYLKLRHPSYYQQYKIKFSVLIWAGGFVTIHSLIVGIHHT